jgi:hypothetical protein
MRTIFFLILLACLTIPQTLLAQQQTPDADVSAPDSAQVAEPQSPQTADEVVVTGPQIFLRQNEYDFGNQNPGTSVTHEFVVQNTGQSELVINDVIPGCGCSVASFTSIIPPGGEGIVTLTVDLYKEWKGRVVNKSATILSNDPVTPNTKIIIRAKVNES